MTEAQPARPRTEAAGSDDRAQTDDYTVHLEQAVAAVGRALQVAVCRADASNELDRLIMVEVELASLALLNHETGKHTDPLPRCSADHGICPEHGDTLVRIAGGYNRCAVDGTTWAYDRWGRCCTETAIVKLGGRPTVSQQWVCRHHACLARRSALTAPSERRRTGARSTARRERGSTGEAQPEQLL